MSCGYEQRIHRASRSSKQVIASKPPILFHVPDPGLNRGSASQLSLDGRREAPALTCNELWNQAEVRRLARHRSRVGQGLPGRSWLGLRSPGSLGSRELIRTSLGVR